MKAHETEPLTRPDHVVVLLLDSLNRYLLGAYGGDEFATPTLDRFAAGAVRFDRHVAGSLPCMPARHDLLCGALDFLWRPWGSIEVWEDAITVPLRRAGVTTVLVSDHPHLFEAGGENYHVDFSAWRYSRGHESDLWRTAPDPSWIGTPALPARPAPGHPRPYDVSRTWFRDEVDFPGPHTMATAARWLLQEAGHHERFLLVVDEFDPHEPFDTPEPYASRYDPDWEGPHLIWPPYAVDGMARGVLTEREGRQLRAAYGAKLTMIDHWVGRVLDALDEAGLAERTAVIVCTDHGHYLGEGDVWGKPGYPPAAPLTHLPLLIRWPGASPGRTDALTTTVDVHATLADAFGVTVDHRTHGRSLVPLLTGQATAVREWALLGYWGREVVVTDGDLEYVRTPVGANAPLSMWSNRWSTMPVHALPDLRLPRPDARAWLDRMPGSDVPVLRQPFDPGDPLPFWAYGVQPDRHLLRRFDDDPFAGGSLGGAGVERQAIELLRAALDEVEAPDDQYRRLGIA